MMATTVNETEILPLTRIVGMPTAITVNRLCKEFYDRAMNLPTSTFGAEASRTRPG